MTDKEIKVISTPEEVEPWPIPPRYVPLWDGNRIMGAFHSSDDIFDLLAYMRGMALEYDMALSVLQFENWQLKGMLKGTFDGNKSLVREQDSVDQCGDGCTCGGGVPPGIAE